MRGSHVAGPRLRRATALLLGSMMAAASLLVPGAGTATAAGSANGIVFDGSPGTGAPPDTLGPYTMTRFDADPQPTGTYVGGVVTPTNEVVAFSPALQHDLVGAGWTTWSNGYSGDVYWGSANVTITLPGGTPAFYFYAEPDPYDVFTISATAQDGTSSGAISVNGYHGAQYFGFYSKGTSRIASISVTGSVDFAIGEFGIGKGKYVALGDSYSSGEGNPPFQAGTDGPADFCHRSDAAYPELIGADRKEKPDFWACSGATTANVTSTSFNNEPPQLSRPDVDKATLVTMTIGGNDAHFSDVLSTCIRQKLVADAYNSLVVGRVGMWLGLGRDPSCVHSAGFWASVMSGVASAASSAESTYAAVKAKASDGATVVVGDYPRLFPADQRDQGCMGLSTFLTYDDMAYMNGAANQLDGGLAASAAAAGVTFADVRPYFAGHEVCGPSGPWLNGISLASGTGKACAWSFKGHCIIPGGLPVVGSFHPNTGGHAGGYYPAFKAAIDAASQSAALASLAVAPRTTATDPPADTFGDLDVLPATPSGPACEGSYQPGQELQVAAGGFAPGAPVEVYVTSPGLGDTAEELAATLTADAAGAVSGTVRIPLAATGFTPQGADERGDRRSRPPGARLPGRDRPRPGRLASGRRSDGRSGAAGHRLRLCQVAAVRRFRPAGRQPAGDRDRAARSHDPGEVHHRRRRELAGRRAGAGLPAVRSGVLHGSGHADDR